MVVFGRAFFTCDEASYFYDPILHIVCLMSGSLDLKDDLKSNCAKNCMN